MKTIENNGIKKVMFTAEELVEIACKAVDMLDIKIGEHGNDWRISEDEYEYGDSTFDYACRGFITLETMQKWDELRRWCAQRFNCPMSLYIGSRGEYEDRYDVYCIEPTDNVAQREKARLASDIERRKRNAELMLKRMAHQKKMREVRAKSEDAKTEMASCTTLGDLDVLAQIKAMIEKGE